MLPRFFYLGRWKKGHDIVNIKIIKWQDANIDKLRELYIRFPYPPYFGSPIVNEKLQEYRFRCVQQDAEASPETFFVAVNKENILCAAQLQRSAHLSDNFGIEVASIGNEAFECNHTVENTRVFLALLKNMVESAIKKKVAFLMASAASNCHQWIRALEDTGFRYADGFIHAVEDMKEDYNHLLLSKMIVRDPIKADFEEILFSFQNVPFPSYLFHEQEFERGKISRLYAKRYREVYENKVGRVFIGEIDGRFMGALNGIIEPRILTETGMVVNHLSQGIILHPRAIGKGVALGLIAFRHNWYREKGMPYCYQGSNINNIPMIRGFQKMKLKHAGIEIKMAMRLKDRL